MIAGLKILLSRSCELANTMEIDKPLVEIDKEFVKTATKFLIGAKDVRKIIPFDKALCPQQHELVALASTADGGLPGFAASMYMISAKESELGNAIKEEGMKRTVPCKEALPRVLQLDLTKAMAIVLARREELKAIPLEIILTGDSLCTACLFSPEKLIWRECWRLMLLTGQNHFPPSRMKRYSPTKKHGVIIAQFCL